MGAFKEISAKFDANWTTVLVGWKGVGPLTWPERWTEFPPLLSFEEIIAYADERLKSSDDRIEQGFIGEILELNLGNQSRESVTDILGRLSDLEDSNPSIEVRKWRLVLLERVLENIPREPLYGLIASSEFWQEFGFPADSPHTVQGRGNAISPVDYYQEENFRGVLEAHRVWLHREEAAIQKAIAMRRDG